MIGHFIGGPLDGETRSLESNNLLYEHIVPYYRSFKLRTRKFLYNKTKLKIGLATIFVLNNLDTSETLINTALIKRKAAELQERINNNNVNKILRRAIR